jgi:hypothetical protein
MRDTLDLFEIQSHLKQRQKELLGSHQTMLSCQAPYNQHEMKRQQELAPH